MLGLTIYVFPVPFVAEFSHLGESIMVAVFSEYLTDLTAFRLLGPRFYTVSRIMQSVPSFLVFWSPSSQAGAEKTRRCCYFLDILRSFVSSTRRLWDLSAWKSVPLESTPRSIEAWECLVRSNYGCGRFYADWRIDLLYLIKSCSTFPPLKWGFCSLRRAKSHRLQSVQVGFRPLP